LRACFHPRIIDADTASLKQPGCPTDTPMERTGRTDRTGHSSASLPIDIVGTDADTCVGSGVHGRTDLAIGSGLRG
jgi:hypothetical protein